VVPILSKMKESLTNMKFACRQCRREVRLDNSGATNHLDGTPACIPIVGDKPMPDWDRHEIVEDEVTLKKEGGEN
jgi:hypothetical protein